jgi:uncharacterized protein (DUF2235 family)
MLLEGMYHTIFLFTFILINFYTCSLAGMLHKVGLLPANNWEQVPFAYRLYKRTTDNAWKASLEFKKTFAADVQIEFVGVWYVTCPVFATIIFSTSNV